LRSLSHTELRQKSQRKAVKDGMNGQASKALLKRIGESEKMGREWEREKKEKPLPRYTMLIAGVKC